MSNTAASGSRVLTTGQLTEEPEGENQGQVPQPLPTDVTCDVPLETLRSLYLTTATPAHHSRRGQMLRRGSSNITYTTVPLEFPPVKRLDPLNKKRILVTGVSSTFLKLPLLYQF